MKAFNVGHFGVLSSLPHANATLMGLASNSMQEEFACSCRSLHDTVVFQITPLIPCWEATAEFDDRSHEAVAISRFGNSWCRGLIGQEDKVAISSWKPTFLRLTRGQVVHAQRTFPICVMLSAFFLLSPTSLGAIDMPKSPLKNFFSRCQCLAGIPTFFL